MVKITKKLVNELLDTPIQTPVSDSVNDMEYIKLREGDEGFKKAIKLFNNFSPIEYSKLIKFKTMKINYGISILFYLIPMQLFGWTKKDIKEMGRHGSKLSFILRILLRNVISTNQLIKLSSKIWNQFLTHGSLKIKTDLKNKKAKILIFDFPTHPIVFSYFEGYFENLIELIIKGNNAKVKYVKSTNNDHTFNATWD